MGKEKRKRSPDFTEVETLTLVEFVAAHKAVLFGTGGKGSSKEEKMKERNWKKAAAVITSGGGREREWVAVRKKWRDLSSKAKAYKAPKTGGGPPEPENTLFERVLDILAKEVVSGIVSEEDNADSQETVASVSSISSSVHQRGEKESCQLPSTSTAAPPTLKPASLRQCEIQEELLQIQKLKLNEKKKQTLVLQLILDVLNKIQLSSKEQSLSTDDLLNSI